MSEYSNRAIDFIKENYSNIIKKEQYISISVGGSVAREYAQNKSDIDLICITDKEKQYKKIFKEISGFPIEIHVIPIGYIYALMSRVKKYIQIDYMTTNSMDIFCMGAKKCNIISKKQDELTAFLSDWREIKKISDSVILKENNFLKELQTSVNRAKINKNLLELYEKQINQYSNIDKIINSLKLYSIAKQKVFSKVLWTDIYVRQYYDNPNIENVLNEISKNNKELENLFFKWEKENYYKLIDAHSKIKCDFCKDDFLQCNIMRCIHDYIIDAKKAKRNLFKYGEVLSIKKAIEYIEYLYKKLSIIDKQLIKIDDLIYIDFEKANCVYEIVKKEVEKCIC